MSAALFISAVSVVIALSSLVLNVWLNQRAAVRARKPVLVFVDEPNEGAWVLRNVGNGPALNVLVAQRADGRWFNPVLVPPCGRAERSRTYEKNQLPEWSDQEVRRYWELRSVIAHERWSEKVSNFPA